MHPSPAMKINRRLRLSRLWYIFATVVVSASAALFDAPSLFAATPWALVDSDRTTTSDDSLEDREVPIQPDIVQDGPGGLDKDEVISTDGVELVEPTTAAEDVEEMKEEQNKDDEAEEAEEEPTMLPEVAEELMEEVLSSGPPLDRILDMNSANASLMQYLVEGDLLCPHRGFQCGAVLDGPQATTTSPKSRTTTMAVPSMAPAFVLPTPPWMYADENAAASESGLEEDVEGALRFLSSRDPQKSRAGICSSVFCRRWPWNAKLRKYVVPYAYSSYFAPEVRDVTLTWAMRFIELYSNLIFVERTDESDYLDFFSGSGCYSSLGRIGGRQVISLEIGTPKQTCLMKSVALHEIFHALGIGHEHQRPDRDDYIEINYANVRKDLVAQLELDKTIETLGVPYDFGSVMHYDPAAFSYNGLDVFTVNRKLSDKDRLTKVLNAEKFLPSACDLRGLNAMYPGERERALGVGQLVHAEREAEQCDLHSIFDVCIPTKLCRRHFSQHLCDEVCRNHCENALTRGFCQFDSDDDFPRLEGLPRNDGFTPNSSSALSRPTLWTIAIMMTVQVVWQEVK